MKMLVLSDSHGNLDNMVPAVEQTRPNRIVPLGDVMRDGEKLHALFPASPFDQVPGNCDLAAFDAPEKLLFLENKRILLCHGHTLHVKEGLLTAMYAALEKQADVLLFGHTHRVFSEVRNGVAMLNPGSIGDARYPTYGILGIAQGQIRICTVSLNGYPES